MAKTAVKPDIFSLPSLTVDKKVRSSVTEEEQYYAALTHQQGWRQLEQLRDRVLEDLDNINELAITQGATKEQLGENVLVISTVKGIIRKMFNVVYDAKEVCGE